VEEVPVHRVRLPERGLDGDLVPAAIGDHLLAAREGLAERVDLPGGDDLQSRGERHVGELEPALVIPLPGRAVRDRVGLLLPGDLHPGLRDKRAGDRRPEVVLPLVDRARADHGVDEVAGELVDKVQRVVLRGAGAARLPVKPLELLLLADVGRKGDDFRVVGFAEPLDDDGRV
jgi:hypothetical protein